MAETLGKIPPAKISSIDIVSFNGGLDQRGAANIQPNSFAFGQNVMLTPQGLATHRPGLRRWLPDTVQPAGQAFPAFYNGVMYYITADNGVIKYCIDGASTWTNAGGSNTITTTGVVNTFMRVLDRVLILNGTDYLSYVDLTTMNVVTLALVADPTLAPTSVPAVLTTGGYKIYYAIWYNGVGGTTNSTPILTQTISKIREQWVVTTGEGITVTDPNTRPAGATSWNLGISTKAAGGTIQLSDILPLAIGLNIGTTTFFDNGSVTPLTNAGLAPIINTTAGPRAKYGVEIEGRAFLFGITGDPYAVMIGGDDIYALNFTPTNGGYRLILNKGTDFFPNGIIGFRNGQGVPSITVLYSSVSGLSKASIIDQTTVSLGTYSMTVWGSVDQNYGASGVSSPYAVINYRGTLIFPSVDGITSIDTSKLRFNVLTAVRVSDPIIDEVGSIKTSLLPQIVGTAWGNRIMFVVPARGFNTNNIILVYDMTIKDAPCWYTYDISAQWIGTVSPPGSPGFSYIAQDNHFFRLDTNYVAQDESSTGLLVPFPVRMLSAQIGTNAAHNGYFAVVQAIYYLEAWVGSVDLIVSWRDYQSGIMKTKVKTVSNGTYTQSTSGGWSSSGYLFNQVLPTTVLAWSDTDIITGAQTPQKINKRVAIPLSNIVTNELQAGFAINLNNSATILRSVSFEGQPLGVSPDVH